MQYEDLHRHYGAHVAQRVMRELTESEFNQVAIDILPAWLEARAEAAHENYRALLNNPLSSRSQNVGATAEACRRWREAEDLAYLIAVAEDVGANARVV